MDRSLKALAALLTYPGDEVLAALPEIRAALEADRRLPARSRKALAALCGELGGRDPLEAQERYVELFDRGRSTCLNLFEHVHGDSRDRGPAMVDLKATYARAGLALAGRELPDFLPALLEFLSLQPRKAARETLRDAAHVVRRIGEALAAQDSAYAAVPAAILAWAGERGLAPRAAPPRDKPLDLEWAEEPVTFGPPAAPATSVIRFMPRPGTVEPGAAR